MAIQHILESKKNSNNVYLPDGLTAYLRDRDLKGMLGKCVYHASITIPKIAATSIMMTAW
jgi:hypothetical protein